MWIDIPRTRSVGGGATMNRKNLIKLLVAIAVTAPVSGYAAPPTPQQNPDVPRPAATALASTRGAWMDCIRGAIPHLDQPPATSEEVARAALSSCADQYAQVTQALTRTLDPACAQDARCAQTALADAEHDATHAALEEVMAARIRVAGAQVLVCE